MPLPFSNHERRKLGAQFSGVCIVENLESRLLNSSHGLILNPAPLKSAVVGNSVSDANALEVRGRSAVLNVVNSAPTDLTQKYEWHVTQAPTGGSVSFAKNGSHSARSNTLTFNKSGTYSVSLTVSDKTGARSTATTTFSVLQTLTGLGMKEEAGRNLSQGGIVPAEDGTQRISASALDQFGLPMAVQPSISWAFTTTPVNGSATLIPDGNSVRFQASRAGLYGVRAVTAFNSFNTIVNVSPVVSSLTLTDIDGTEVSTMEPSTVTAASQRWSVRAVDQFGNSMTSLPSIAWSATTAPSGGRLTASLASGVVKVSFSRAGSYVVRAQSGTASFSMPVNVVPTLTSLSLRTPENRELTSRTALSVTGATQQLNAVGLDQFKAVLAEQPVVTWQIVTQPAEDSGTLSEDGNQAVVSVSRAGSYLLRASSDAVSSDVSLSVLQTMNSFSLTTLDGQPVDTNATVTVSTVSQQWKVRGVDQFGNVITSNPSIKWTTTSAPTGGTVNRSFSAGVIRLTFNRTGAYTVSAQSGSATLSLTANVLPTLTSLKVRTPDGREVPRTGLTTTAASQQLTPIALDQFGLPLAEQPEFTWQTVSAPDDSDPDLTPDRDSVLAEFSRSGVYVLRATNGVLTTDVSITVSSSLVSLNLTGLDGTPVSSTAPISISAASQYWRLAGIDQFGNSITAFRSVKWTVLSAPSGGRLSTTVRDNVLKASFSRLGDYGLRGTVGVGSGGAVSVNVTVAVVPAVTSLIIRTPENREVSSRAPVAVSGSSQRLNVLGLDQYGAVLAEQPVIEWLSTSGPTGGTATLTPDGNSVVAAFDRAGTYVLRATSGTTTGNVSLNVIPSLSSLSLTTPEGTLINSDQPLAVDSITQQVRIRGVDQFGNAMASLGSVRWTTPVVPAGGSASVRLSGEIATITFTRRGSYTLIAQSGNASHSIPITVSPTLKSLSGILPDNRTVTNAAVVVGRASQMVTFRGIDQFGQTLNDPEIGEVSSMTTPSGATTSTTTEGNSVTFAFNKTGSYSFRVQSGNAYQNVSFSVVSAASSLQVTPGTSSVVYRASQQFQAQVFDQFEQVMTVQPTVTWSASGGTISSRGVFTAGTQGGTFSVTAILGDVSASVEIQISAPTPATGLTDPALSTLVNTFYVDAQLDRSEIMQVLRSAGNDGVLESAELTDFQFLASMDSPYDMPGYVQTLTKNLVTSNPANRMYRGQTAGNLAPGSSATLLNNLVDKWFLGSDEPQISASGLSYQTSVGNLFNGAPSRADAKQGMLGDCYFIAAVSAIADENADTIRNMFVDNGDGTYTVRFYGAGVADYVTVNRRLPAYSSGVLGYSSYGRSISSTDTTLWIAMAEKAYAQWNETGKEGRDGTNRYAAIEGGWMSYVNAQVLGFSSSNFGFTSNDKQTLINSLNTSQAVTLGTYGNATAGGLVGSHAYIVVAHNATTDTFQLHNPWGVSHPSPLTWAQLQTNCSMFTVTNPTGAGSVGDAVSMSSGEELVTLSGVSPAAAPVKVSKTSENLTSIAQPLLTETESIRVERIDRYSPTDLESVLDRVFASDRTMRTGTPKQSQPTIAREDSLSCNLLDLVMLELNLDELYSSMGPSAVHIPAR